jgi:HEPN domain-containing protein
LVEKAEEDFEIARLLGRRKRLLTDGITFHSQQCAEKYLKGLLVLRGQIPPKTHDLVTLYDLCLGQGILVPISTADLQRLSDYAVRSRYPGDDPTPEEARYAFEVAKAVRQFAKRLL